MSCDVMCCCAVSHVRAFGVHSMRWPYKLARCCCRLLIYTPRHPFIREALKTVTRNVLSNFTAHRSNHVVHMTGPPAYHQGGVIPLLEGNGYATVRRLVCMPRLAVP